MGDAAPFRTAGGGLLLDVKALPGASKTEMAGLREGRLTIRIAAAAEDGKANAELIAFLAKALGCAKKDIALYSGEKSRLKTLALPAQLKERAETLAAGGLLRARRGKH
ncbi:MAG: DUF167 domain-containing protein [Treponema sp.]|nr:DUF167 domain-containing protein [Treponema sp.]